MTGTLFDPNALVRANFFTLKPYTPILPFEVLSRQLGRTPAEIIKLDANENPYGPSPLVAGALAEAPFMHIYPDPESRELRAALAEYTGLEADYIMVGHGADELIDLLMRLFIEPGDRIVNCPPTFGMYAFDAGINAAQVINVTRRPDFSIPVEEIEALFQSPEEAAPRSDAVAGLRPSHPGGRGQETGPSMILTGSSNLYPKIIIATSPNNPDGSLLGDTDLRRLLALPAMVVLDEAYVEFCAEPSRIQWVKDYPNLIVLRTFSKWAGLAGLRVGYGAFPPALMDHLWKIKQPYNVNVAGQVAALASLKDRERLLGTVAQLIKNREQLYKILMKFVWLRPYLSQTNFVLCRVDGRSALEVKEKLARQGILVRYYNSPGLSDHIRISIGTTAQLERLQQGLEAL